MQCSRIHFRTTVLVAIFHACPLSQLPDWVLKLTICRTDIILADVNVWLMLFCVKFQFTMLTMYS